MQKSELKILIITPGFAENEEDTSALPYLQDYVLCLANIIGRHNIKIVPIHYPFTRINYTWNGIDVFPSGGENKKNISLIFTLRRTLKAINKLMRNDTYILHSFWLLEATLLAQHIAKKKHLKHIATLMGQDAKPANKYLRLFSYDKMKIVALSEMQEKLFHNSTGEHAHKIIPLPIPVIEKINISENRDIDILFVGSLIPVKQPIQFIEVIHELFHDYANLKVVMIGAGNLLQELEKLIEELGLQNVIQLTGNLKREDVFSYMLRSKVLLHTSSYEGQGMIYSEALAHGMHVVSYAVGRIENTNKHLVCNSLDEMKIVLYKLLQNELSFEQFVSIKNEEVINQYLELYLN